MTASSPGSGRFLWSISFAAGPEQAPFLEACLDPICESVTSVLDDKEVVCRIEGVTRDEPDRVQLRAALNAAFPDGDAPKPVIDLIPPRDWLKENVFDFPPLDVGRFHIRGSHIEGPPPLGRIPLVLDAGTAFGSGEHGSTSGCLRALQDLSRRHRPGRVLDMGCGSGILAIAAAKLFGAPVVATDIDEEARRVTRLNAERNGVGGLVTAVAAPGYAAPAVRRGAPYDLIIENILARPIRRLSRDLARHLAPGGRAVLSGLIARDTALVVTAHRHQGLRLIRHITLGGWRTLVLEKPA